MGREIAIIGSGFSSLSAAAYLAKEGYDVSVFEKNKTIGGRARQFSESGFTFDMGPSWYWMPEVIESFYNDFGYTASDFYELKRLSPAFKIVFENNEEIVVPDSYDDLRSLFEDIEPGSSVKLDSFMEDAKLKYDISFKDLIELPGISLSEYLKRETIYNSFRLKIFSSYQKLVNKHFHNQKLRSLMEFPVLFLGAKPSDTPALYSLMNYAGLKLGTWYPQGGFYSVVKAMTKICEENGVKIYTDSTVNKINIKYSQVISLSTDKGDFVIDGLVGGADYHHIEQKLLDEQYRNYTEKYWSKKTFAPSSLIFYLGVDKKIEGINHHTLFFDADFENHAEEIYDSKKWPKDPLFYVCTPSVSDTSVAPEGKENMFVLIPIATGLTDSEELRDRYYENVMERLENHLGQKIRDHVIYKKSYCVNDFKHDYNAYEGNAYGLANTLSQTAVLKPKIINKKINNLIYTGQLTVPGPGVPPSIISGRIAANVLSQNIKVYESTF